MILFAGFADGDAIESDGRLNKQRLEEIIGDARDVRKAHILSQGLNQFTPDVEFDIWINLRIVIGRYKKLQIVLIYGANGFLRDAYHPEHRRPCGLVRTDLKLATNRRYLRRGGHDSDALLLKSD